MYKSMSWWDKVIQGGQHTSFRLLSLIFSGASAWAIYWFFQALGDDPVQHLFTVLTSVGFVALGYFVTRGLAHRMMNKQRVRSYIPLALLYIVVEVSCNFAHAAAKYPQVSYPSMPAPPVTNGKQQGGQNALKSWWAGQRAGASSASGLSPSARNNLQAASSNGVNAGIP